MLELVLQKCLRWEKKQVSNKHTQKNPILLMSEKGYCCFRNWWCYCCCCCCCWKDSLSHKWGESLFAISSMALAHSAVLLFPHYVRWRMHYANTILSYRIKSVEGWKKCLRGLNMILPRADSKANIVRKGVVIYIEHYTCTLCGRSTNADNIRMKVGMRKIFWKATFISVKSNLIPFPLR